MKTFAEIIEIVKSLKGVTGDGEVAVLLDIKPKTLATSKLRNSIPFEELTSFCNKEGVSLNWLLTGVGEERLVKGARPLVTREASPVYNAGDSELREICEFLKESPIDKKLILKVVKAKKELKKATKEAMEGLVGVNGLVVEG